ncbi:3'(2'),5'-bisphosphate nucleotidase CysQ family protein [Campylobacter geochelonis]|uniref:3'(2'),5'-bisphosphate nucleotidase CysQ family protein n=1 Tax=Campylobacter geochelonis TaxID=1780362 RepID=UPI0007709363|nr:inositol monophosphatase family protein [Campylobacter geochelonis]CZE51044.1 3'(2')%2C5'-bisphosphate nucleotidase [Campylobacter geochelonis]
MSELDIAIAAAKEAGEKILEFRELGFKQKLKSDNSIVTQADISSNEIITNHLSKTGIAICSEESIINDDISEYWLIDPLDGTANFVKNSNDFSILISLISSNKPILSVIYSPVYKQCMSCNGKNIFINGVEISNLRVDISPNILLSGMRKKVDESANLREKIRQNIDGDIISVGSGMKFYKLALGSAGIYIRNKVSHSWDIAAGDLIVQASGGVMVGIKDKKELQYDIKTLRNEPFIALSKENVKHLDKFLKIINS